MADRATISTHDYDLDGICGPDFVDCIGAYQALTGDFAALFDAVRLVEQSEDADGNFPVSIHGHHD